jgi:hypothetical protein
MPAKLVDKAREHVQKEYGLDKSYFKEVYLSKYNGCVPEGRIGNDLLTDIEAKFYYLLGSIRDMVDEDLKRKGRLPEQEYAKVHICARYEDCSSVLVVFRKHVLYSEHRKAWHFSWPNEAEMEAYLQEVYQTLKKNMVEVISGRDPK